MARIRFLNYMLRILYNTANPTVVYTFKELTDRDGRYVQCFRELLNSYGFGYLHLVGPLFSLEHTRLSLKTKVSDVFWQQWYATLNNNQRLRYYKLYKSGNSMESFLKSDLSIGEKRALCKIRSECYANGVESGRYENINFEDRLHVCIHCNRIDTIYHVICKCSKYDSFRPDFLSHFSVNDFLLFNSDIPNSLLKLYAKFCISILKNSV